MEEMQTAEAEEPLPSSAPEVESGMSRELENVQNCGDFILMELEGIEDCCHTYRTYQIQSSSRRFDKKEKRFSVEEVGAFPVVFQVREWADHCDPEAVVHIGIFPSDTPDQPAEGPLVYWNESMYHLLSFEVQRSECVIELCVDRLNRRERW